MWNDDLQSSPISSFYMSTVHHAQLLLSVSESLLSARVCCWANKGQEEGPSSLVKRQAMKTLGPDGQLGPQGGTREGGQARHPVWKQQATPRQQLGGPGRQKGNAGQLARPHPFRSREKGWRTGRRRSRCPSARLRCCAYCTAPACANTALPQAGGLSGWAHDWLVDTVSAQRL